MNLKSKKWTILLLIFLIVLAISVFIQFSLGLGVFRSDVKSIFLNSFSQNPFQKQSRVNVWLVDSKLKMDFEIADSDKPIFNRFIGNWFGTMEEIKYLDFGIDENLIQTLSPILPVKLDLKVTDKSLEFNSQAIPALQTAIIGTEINFSTDSGRFKLKYSNPTEYKVEIENPSDVVPYATASGVFTASSKIEGLFKSLTQVSTIDLSVSGKNISGKIILR